MSGTRCIMHAPHLLQLINFLNTGANNRSELWATWPKKSETPNTKRLTLLSVWAERLKLNAINFYTRFHCSPNAFFMSRQSESSKFNSSQLSCSGNGLGFKPSSALLWGGAVWSGPLFCNFGWMMIMNDEPSRAEPNNGHNTYWVITKILKFN